MNPSSIFVKPALIQNQNERKDYAMQLKTNPICRLNSLVLSALKKIIRIIASYDEFDEDIHTLRYMKDKGIDNVRGGSFCELNLTNDNVSTIAKMLRGSEDKCYYCGHPDHFINECPQRKVRRNV